MTLSAAKCRFGASGFMHWLGTLTLPFQAYLAFFRCFQKLCVFGFITTPHTGTVCVSILPLTTNLMCIPNLLPLEVFSLQSLCKKDSVVKHCMCLGALDPWLTQIIKSSNTVLENPNIQGSLKKAAVTPRWLSQYSSIAFPCLQKGNFTKEFSYIEA